MSQLEEMNTALADIVGSAVGEGNVPLPSNIDRTLPIVVATDNNDLLEDTVTGVNTTHCTNTILIQRARPSVAPEPAPDVQLTRAKSHKRSLSSVFHSDVPAYVSSRRCGPGQYVVDMASIPGTSDYKKACSSDFQWLLARLPGKILLNRALELLATYAYFQVLVLWSGAFTIAIKVLLQCHLLLSPPAAPLTSRLSSHLQALLSPPGSPLTSRLSSHLQALLSPPGSPLTSRLSSHLQALLSPPGSFSV